METICFGLGMICGAGIFWLCGGKTKEKQRPLAEERQKSRQNAQWENFWRYDGTGRGQSRLED